MRKEETSAAVVGSKGVGRKGSAGSARRVVDEGVEEEEGGDFRPVRESQIDMFVRGLRSCGSTRFDRAGRVDFGRGGDIRSRRAWRVLGYATAAAKRWAAIPLAVFCTRFNILLVEPGTAQHR